MNEMTKAVADAIVEEFTPRTTIDPLTLMADFGHYQEMLSAWVDLEFDTDALLAEGVPHDEAAEQLMDQHATLADLLGLTPTTDEFPVVARCGCGNFLLWNRDTPAVTVWDARRELDVTVPHCGCRSAT